MVFSSAQIGNLIFYVLKTLYTVDYSFTFFFFVCPFGFAHAILFQTNFVCFWEYECIWFQRINAINAQYQEQLVALRAQHATRRDEFLRRESHSRQQQYQQAAGGDHYPSGGGIGGSSDPQGYNAVAAPSREPSARSYNADNYDTYRERGRFLGNSRNHEPEPRAQYPGGGRVYDTGSRYYWGVVGAYIGSLTLGFFTVFVWMYYYVQSLCLSYMESCWELNVGNIPLPSDWNGFAFYHTKFRMAWYCFFFFS